MSGISISSDTGSLAAANAGTFLDSSTKPRRQPIGDHTAHAPGQVCELCGAVIVADQAARKRPDGWWVHEECPIKW